MHGGTKTNVIPDLVELEVDIRTLPGQTGDEVLAQLHEALGDLADRGRDRIERRPVDRVGGGDAAVGFAVPGDRAGSSTAPRLVPFLMIGGTDNRFFRRAGSVGYGFGLFSQRIDFEGYATMFHGNDERVDAESLGLSEQLWEAVAHDLLD